MRRSFFTWRVYFIATFAWMLLQAFLWLKDLVAIGPGAESLKPIWLWLTTQSMLLWGVFSMFILAASQRLDFDKGKRVRMVTLHLGAWICLAYLWRNNGHVRLGRLTVLDWTCAIVIAGCLQTVVVRLQRIMAALKTKSAPD